MKRLLTLVFVLFVLFVSTAAAQCPGGKCNVLRPPVAVVKVAVKATASVTAAVETRKHMPVRKLIHAVIHRRGR